MPDFVEIPGSIQKKQNVIAGQPVELALSPRAGNLRISVLSPSKALVVGLWIAACGGDDLEAERPADLVSTEDCEIDLTIERSGCLPWNCGANSPIVGAAEYHLLGEEGEVTIARLDEAGRIVPGTPTIQYGPRSAPTEIEDLGVEGGAFTANGEVIDVDPDRQPWLLLVEDEDMAGDQPPRTCVISVEGSEDLSSYDEEEATAVPTYELAIKRPEVGWISLCRDEQSWADWQYTDALFDDELVPTVASSAALLVATERYDAETVTVTSAPEWFNIACAGSALAKMRLMGLDPERDPDGRSDRQTALKMLTGRFCSPPDGTHWTVPGVPLAIARCSDPQGCETDLVPQRSSVVLEAYWDEEGATCLGHTRLFSDVMQTFGDPWLPDACASNSDPLACEQKIREHCGLPSCSEGDFQTAWKTGSVAHPDH